MISHRLSDEESIKLYERWMDSNEWRTVTFFKWVNRSLPYPQKINGTVAGRDIPRLYLRCENDHDFVVARLSWLS